MRDLGGYATNSNGYTTNNLFIRSDLPKKMSDNEKCFFVNKNIKTIIDLRSKNSFEKKPNCFKDLSEFNVINIPLKRIY